MSSTTTTPSKPKIHTSDLPRDLTTPTTTTSPSKPTPSKPSSKPLPPSMQATLTTALLSSPTGSIQAIEKCLTQELAASGWTTALREHIKVLVRSGECASYGEIVRRVLSDVGVDDGSSGDSKGGNGETNGKEGSGGLVVPERVVREGVKVIRRELEKVATVVVDD